MKTKCLALIVAGLFIAAFAGCSDDNTSGTACDPNSKEKCPPPGTACPPKGIGVAEHDGYTVQAQIAYWKNFKCETPQICPDIGGRAGHFFIGQGSAPGELTFNITNCSTGNKKLVISGVTLLGDSRCYFTKVTDSDIQPTKEVAPGESTIIRTTYDPKKAGEDHAGLRVASNAENYANLDLLVCGLAELERLDGGVAPPPTGDGGPADLSSSTPDAATGLSCKKVTSATSCP